MVRFGSGGVTGKTLIAGCLVGLVAGFVAFQLVGTSDRQALRSFEFSGLPPGTPGSAQDAREALRGADAVITGTIISSVIGRTVGPEGEPGVTFIEVSVQVDEVFASKPEFPFSVGDVLLVEIEASANLVFEGESGTQVFSALWLKRDEASAGRYFRPISFGSWLTIDRQSGNLVSPLGEDDKVGGELSSLGLEGVAQLLGDVSDRGLNDEVDSAG